MNVSQSMIPISFLPCSSLPVNQTVAKNERREEGSRATRNRIRRLNYRQLSHVCNIGNHRSVKWCIYHVPLFHHVGFTFEWRSLQPRDWEGGTRGFRNVAFCSARRFYGAHVAKVCKPEVGGNRDAPWNKGIVGRNELLNKTCLLFSCFSPFLLISSLSLFFFIFHSWKT